MSVDQPPTDELPTSIKVAYGSKTVTVPLGKRNQSVRWLATAVADLAKSHRLRGALQSTSGNHEFDDDSSATPHSIRIVETNELIGPSMKVVELLKRMIKLGPDVVEAGLRIEVDGRRTTHPTGKEPAIATRPLWTSLAFANSKASQEEALKELDVFREAMRVKNAQEAEDAAAEEKTQLARLGRLLVSDADDPETMERNFTYDWSNIRVSLITKDPDQFKKLRREMHRWYTGLTDMFTHFSGGGARGSLFTMQRSELQHLIVSANILDIIKEKKMMERCFDKAKGGREIPEADPESMIRFEFLEAMLHLSFDKFGRELDPRNGLEVGAAEGFTRMMNTKLGVLITKLNAGPVRAALKHNDMHAFLLPRLPALLAVFDFYASLDAEGDHAAAVEEAAKARAKASRGHTGIVGAAGASAGAKKSSLMNLKEFIVLLEHSGLLDDVTVMSSSAGMASATAQLKSQKATLTAQEVRETFAGVQRDDDGSGIEGSDAADELTFGEFLEACGQVAIAKWGDSVGLKYVLDVRGGAKGAQAAAAAGLGGDLFMRAEHTLVRALIIWTYSAMVDTREHLGVPMSAPVQYDVNDLMRMVASGHGDLMAASSTRGAVSNKAAAAAAAAAEAAAAAAEAASADPAGPGMAPLLGRATKPRNPFASTVESFRAARPATTERPSTALPVGVPVHGHVFGLGKV